MTRVFPIFALLFGLPLVFLIPPFQTPDEPAHLYRAYQISEGDIIAKTPTGQCGGLLPRSLPSSFAPFSFRLLETPPQKVSRQKILDALKIPLDPQDREFIVFANVIYSPIPYLPQSTAILFGRWMNLGPLKLMYLGRLANLIAFILLGTLAIHLLPAFHRPMTLIMLMPMMLFLAASLSGDVMTDALALLFSALVFRATARTAVPTISNRFWLCLIFIGVGLTLCKFAYVPLILLALLISTRQFGSAKRQVTLLLTLFIICISAEILWAVATSGLNAQINAAANPRAQISNLLHHPLYIFHVIGNSLARDAWTLMLRFVGARLGWLNANMPALAAPLYLILLWSATWPSHEDPPAPMLRRVAITTLLAIVGSMLAVALLNYIFWDRVGDPWFDGMQGRYFIPVAAAIVLLFRWGILAKIPKARWNRLPHPVQDRIVIAAAFFSGLMTILTVYLRYYA